MQIVGKKCVVCEKPIVTIIDADWCRACKSPFHSQCNNGIATCPNCQADLNTEINKSNAQAPLSTTYVRDGSDLSHRCALCGSSDVAKKVSVKVSWVPSWVWIFVLFWPALIFVYAFSRKTGHLKIGLCEKHTRAYRALGVTAISAMIAAPVFITWGIAEKILAMQLIGAMLFIFAAFSYAKAQLVSAREIHDGHIRLSEQQAERLLRGHD